jgi:hypothetical protein
MSVHERNVAIERTSLAVYMRVTVIANLVLDFSILVSESRPITFYFCWQICFTDMHCVIVPRYSHSVIRTMEYGPCTTLREEDAPEPSSKPKSSLSTLFH